jgi:hypothetical protein
MIRRTNAPSRRSVMKFDIPTSYRKNRLIHEHVHDPYKTSSKPLQPTVCPICCAVFKEGRWQWADSWPPEAHRQICQACHRTRDGYPAGVVTISGNFALSHELELLSLIRHRERQENREHPEHRIMRIEQKSDAIVIETTDVHLPQAIGKALHDAFKGRLNFRYPEESYFVEVKWNRES